MRSALLLIAVGLAVGLACGEGDSGQGGSGSNGSCGGDGDGAPLCGCPEAATLDYEATVWNPQLDAPVADAIVTCLGEDDPITISTADGTIAFVIDTDYQPGCGYLRCNHIVIDATDQGLQEAQVGVEATNGERIDLQYLPD